MAITDIQISEELETNAPSIKYRGNEGPKSPQEQMQMAGPDRYFKILEFMLNELEGELGRELTDEEYEEVGRRAMDEFQQSGGQPLPNDPTKPVNPFAPKPTGPVLPDRQMAAYGGIMGMDGRKQYGIGSFFQKYIKDPIEMAFTGKSYEDLERESQERVDSEPEGYESYLDTLFKGKKGEDKQGNETREDGLNQYIIPAIGGAVAGLFTKKNEDGTTSAMAPDQTALALADLKKSANVLGQKEGLAAGLNFLPAESARKYSPTEMIEVYKTAAANGGRIDYNLGGRIGMAEGGIMDLGGMEKDYRAEGGFVPIGREEKADDVPARLSVNEFVFTADAVRSAGGGDIDQGAKVMENMMKHLEAGGQVSEESQGLGGAREMFETSERLSEVI
jgi:hypothetical protein